ncbi:MAG: 50S ribosomal protein L24 [Methylomonas sp.]|nr:50S ribosomal protein L24 [Methylomonas sp.]
MRRIKKGDQVIVIAGKDKGKRGSVLSVLAGDKLVIEGINLVRKHQRPNPMRGVEGGIVDKAMPIHTSNVALFNSATSKADRVGFRLLADGRKVRFYKSTNELIDA